MRAVVQRANGASCVVAGKVTGAFDGMGLVVLLGITHTDGPREVATMVKKIARLRIFDSPDEEARGSESSALQLGLPILLISQFTLYGEVRKGNRPSWLAAAPGETAAPLVDAVANGLQAEGLQIERGVFGADMKVSFTNEGPFTIWIEV